ncbi:hypothetical protein CHGG_07981 [Chaetomium globosum CBS 148.51]|uniref:Uncharacterized protein n=1 Tax=Chaetomium globosum (strain ATCC 6205 / CBS 148.51 / DSM 1962 / NBRC 6347 / NRRL 1970) TaxID=306901 RepID=Q2GVM3_CHAGB|nr:uncharacterized protein CHGG_07981 [Chaetomium globosum CBS 148.51]EAQ86728.1 hypothetical protein CHGG_07981 [Chaetomium globosum CBS 148.51]
MVCGIAATGQLPVRSSRFNRTTNGSLSRKRIPPSMRTINADFKPKEAASKQAMDEGRVTAEIESLGFFAQVEDHDAVANTIGITAVMVQDISGEKINNCPFDIS